MPTRHIKPSDGPFEKFKSGDRVAHITLGDGVVTHNDGRYIHAQYQRARGVYDTLWFNLYPTWLFHRKTAPTR